MTAALQENVLEVAGIRAPMISAGDPTAEEAVVFIHGNPGSSRDWADLVEAVGPFARALAWDEPGYGQASKPPDFDYTVDGYARFVDQAMTELGVQRAHLVLHDFGGGWGLRWALDHPDSFASLVLINTGALIGYSWHAFAKIWRTPLLGELFMATTIRPVFKQSLKIGNPRGLPSEFLDRMYDDFDTPTRKAVLKLYRASPAAAFERMAPALRALDPPTLVVWGAKDPYIPVEQAEMQKRTFPRAEVHVLEDSGHWPFMDDPERTRELVVPFLRRTTGAG